MRRMLIAAAALALALTGCEMRAEISVNDDGSGTLGVVFGMEPLLFGTMPGDADPLLQMRRALQDDPIGWKVEELREPALRGFRATVPFRNLEHLRELLEQREGADASSPYDFGSQGGFGDLPTIEKLQGGGWRFEATGEAPAADVFGTDGPLGNGGHFGGEFDPQYGVGVGDPLGSDPLADLDFTPTLPTLPSGADDVLRFEFHVTLPGARKATNADEVKEDGGRATFIWRGGFFDDKPRLLEASTEPAPWRPPMLPIALLIVGGVAGGLFFARKRLTSVPTPPVVLEGLPVGAGGDEQVALAAPPVFEEPVQASLLDELGGLDGEEKSA